MTVYTFPANQSKIEQAFKEFDAAHPEVYEELLYLARSMKRRGRKFGIATLYEVVRWQQHTLPRLNNNYRAYYARKIMAENPDLDGIFKTRELSVPHHTAP